MISRVFCQCLEHLREHAQEQTTPDNDDEGGAYVVDVEAANFHGAFHGFLSYGLAIGLVCVNHAPVQFLTEP